eukprot:TRINITY_DN425_c3_g1_i10.p2 TRINITY_DN425_c3_g1~~TRINITY_DN425_c3_g1_i10.p2  ORF type:complete len:147 (-),score=6.57 TRINITY_DN425_c3_g1_i10:657-1097(-)
MRHEQVGPPRPKIGKQDKAQTMTGVSLVTCQNETVFNPQTPQYFAIYCLQDADIGGESLICHNKGKSFVNAAVGMIIPEHLLAELQARSWRHTYSFKLKPGDWLVLDNLKVQHGRMQYTDVNVERTLLANMWGKRHHDKPDYDDFC